MNNLLGANFARLRRDRVFWLCLAALAVCSAFSMLNGCRQAAANADSGFVYQLDHFYFNLAPALGLFGAVFTSLFLGTDYSDGTVRNKLVVGHSRTAVYLADLSVSFCAALLFMAAWLAGGLVGIPFLGPWKLGGTGLALCLLLTVLFLAALTAIFTWVSTAFTNRAVGAVVSILLFLALLVCASMLYNRLCEPEMLSGVVITAEGMTMGEPVPNPDYISGGARAACEFLLDLLPTGQSILLANLELAHPVREALCSLFLTAAAVIAGLWTFRKKDLK
ncbi:ABC transporter permease subunit [Allofournierella sp.]|uniref:ABC transporter permease subunit n=1 Tax=Allofournierella sp. TaxID=1940256 RepID=UPI003AB15DFA